MAHVSWGSGWPNCRTADIVTVTSNGLRLPVRKEIAPLVTALVAHLARARGRAFRAEWSWGFACRAISGTSSPSNHSWGLAVDLDAPENPYLSATSHASPHPLRKSYDGRLLRSTMPLNASSIARKYGFTWGGQYTSKPDPMHFEFVGSAADAARIARTLEPTPKRWRIVARRTRRPVVAGWVNVKRRTRKLKKRGYRIISRKRVGQ